MTIDTPNDLRAALTQFAYAAEAIAHAPAGGLLALNAEAVLTGVRRNIARAEAAIQNLRSAGAVLVDRPLEFL